jgi:imidazole glycerol-phosphate synthase subunit HisF
MKQAPRIIPVLGIMDGGLWKTREFVAPRYVGDPINALRVFNEKEVDEVLLMGFRQSLNAAGLPKNVLSRLAGEAQMPLGYGGGIRCLDEVKWLMDTGFEKVVFNTALSENPGLIEDSAKLMGSSSVLVSLDYRIDKQGRRYCYIRSGTKPLGMDLISTAIRAGNLGTGELILHYIEGEGCYTGYDSNVLEEVKPHTPLPLVLAGGCRGKLDFTDDSVLGASGLAASSCFVFYGKHRAVLIHY